jgi:hypothetical protein
MSSRIRWVRKAGFVARHSSPPGRHALETRPTPGHRRIAADSGSHRAGAVATRSRGTTATLAGGALSLAGATAAGWVAAHHLPALLDVVLESDAAPAARTVVLVAQGSEAAEEVPADPPASVDPAAVAASATRAATTPKPVNRTSAPAAAAANPGTAAQASTDRGGESSGGSESADSNSNDSGSNDSGSNDSGSSQSGSNESSTQETGSTESRSSDSGSSGSESGNSGSTDADSAGSDRDQSSDGDSGSGANSDSGAQARAGTDTRTPAGSPGAAPAARGTVTGNLPSDIIDTKDWYLTLPTGKEGSPDLVEGSALARYHSQYFDLSPGKDGVVFTAATNGATTSGSQYPRSELREMFGSEKASWDGRKGRHTMEIVQAITETPKEKPDVIAGQIHGTSDDLMQIHLSGERLTVKYADGQKFVDLDPNYKLGTMFAVKIESAGGRVKVWYNGQQKADLPISSSTSYFKAGVYTNSNPSKGDESGEGKVVIRSLAVRHT